jgi:signal transduction histidine kinase/CheY-like chemotaxis protein
MASAREHLQIYRGEQLLISQGLVIATLAISGMLFSFVGSYLVNGTQLLDLGLILYGLAGAAWLLAMWKPSVGRWFVLLSVVTLVHIIDLWFGVPGTIGLLATTILLAVSMIGLKAAISLAICETLLLLLWISVGREELAHSARLIAIIGIWATMALTYAIHTPIQQVLEWMTAQYQYAQKLLEETRDNHLALREANEDLTRAYVHLTRMDKLLRTAYQQAEAAQQSKEQFVANVSHELRTPLNMIIGFSEMILESPRSYGGSLPANLLADLEVIHRNSQYLSELIGDVLDLSQIETGQMALSKESVSLQDIIHAATIAVRPLFESKSLSLETDISKDLPAAFCDPVRVREVVLNLLSNAGRFTEGGGVRIQARLDGEHICVRVRDTGPGISQSDLGRLFQPFQQLDGSIRRRYGGTGLGLSISRHFVELHGGNMWVESTVGEGSTFCFTLPLTSSLQLDAGPTRWIISNWEHLEHSRPATAPRPLLQPRFILLDAGDALQRLLHRYLDGADIISVSTWEEAIQELSIAPAQALLVNGSSVSESLQEYSTSAKLPFHTPVIFCAVPNLTEVENSLGISSYLVKPVSREVLLAALDRLQLWEKRANPQHITALIADDEPDAVRLFWRILNSADRPYRVITAVNGQQALQLLRTQCPDVMLLDLVMPGLDGFQVLAAKNADPTIRNIPTLVLSAHDPAGYPLVSSAVAAVRGSGLSVPQLLSSIKALAEILTPTSQLGDLKQRVMPSE